LDDNVAIGSRLFDLDDNAEDRIAPAYQEELVIGNGALSRHKSASSLAAIFNSFRACLLTPLVPVHGCETPLFAYAAMGTWSS
jgi:hypothetical protein